MRIKIDKIIFLMLALFVVRVASAQVNQVNEEDIDFSILKWHYAKYPQTEAVWETIALSDSKIIYRAAFKFGECEVLVMYNEQGKLLSEKVEYGKNIPTSIKNYLDDIYSKYRVTSFVKSTNFMNDEVSYKMDLTSKEKGIEKIVFDRNLIPFDSHSVADGMD